MMSVSLEHSFVKKMGFNCDKYFGLSSPYITQVQRKDLIPVALSKVTGVISHVSYDIIDHKGFHYIPSLVEEDEIWGIHFYLLKASFVFKITDEVEVTSLLLLGIWISAASSAFSLSIAPLLLKKKVWRFLRNSHYNQVAPNPE